MCLHKNGGNLTEYRKLQDKEPYDDIIKEYDLLLLLFFLFLFGAIAPSGPGRPHSRG
jgi:hypothetical protein